MWFKQTKKVKGINCEYRSLSTYKCSKKTKKTIAVFDLYVNRVAKIDNTNNSLDQVTIQVDGVDLKTKDIYIDVKKNKEITNKDPVSWKDITEIIYSFFDKAEIIKEEWQE